MLCVDYHLNFHFTIILYENAGFQEVQQSSLLDPEICSNHEACEARRDQIRIMKGFIGKELVKGHMVSF